MFMTGLFYSPTTADFFFNFNTNIEKASEISRNLIFVGDLNEDLPKTVDSRYLEFQGNH